jgi:osmotically-inducible protein OsmY
MLRAKSLATISISVACLALGTVTSLQSCSTTQPAGEQISDATITTKIKSKFMADPDVSVLNISVETEEGVVYLTGRVDSQEQKEEAEKLARNTDGVRSVVNHIEVGDRT